MRSDDKAAPEQPYERTDGPVHTWFGLSYANYLVWPRTLMQSMPLEWQRRFTGLAEELDAAFAHLDRPEAYKAEAAEEHEAGCLTPEQMSALGISAEDGICTDAAGREMTNWERVLIPVHDPVPHYNRGRTYLPPDEDAIAACKAARDQDRPLLEEVRREAGQPQ